MPKREGYLSKAPCSTDYIEKHLNPWFDAAKKSGFFKEGKHINYDFSYSVKVPPL